MFKQIKNLGVITCVARLSDNAFVPFDPANTDYQHYLVWVAEGNTPLPPDEESAEGRIEALEGYLREHLDTVCLSKGFDNYQSAMNWAGYPNPWQTTAHALADWIALSWAEYDNILAAINSHMIPIPDKDAYLAMLPVAPDVYASPTQMA